MKVLTVSDRASTGVYDDLSGPAILQFFADAIDSPWCAGMIGCSDGGMLLIGCGGHGGGRGDVKHKRTQG